MLHRTLMDAYRSTALRNGGFHGPFGWSTLEKGAYILRMHASSLTLKDESSREYEKPLEIFKCTS